MRTIPIFQDKLQKYLASKGLAIRKITEKNDVLALIESLRPFKTDKNLIRLGNHGDGGYLVPDDLEGITACFSPGIGQSSSFELDCANYGMEVFLADKSVDGPLIENAQFHFTKKYIGPVNNNDFMTMDHWVNDAIIEPNSDLMMQMDIEGHEYLSLVAMSDTLLQRCRILVFEFHYLDKLWNPEFFKVINAAVMKILRNHVCIHIHPNNCCGIERLNGIDIPRAMEFTFIRKDRISSIIPANEFPHALDFDCTPNKTLVLPKSWYI